MSPEDIAALLQKGGSGLSPDEYDEAEESTAATQRRTELLKPVLNVCEAISDSQSDELALVAQKLGDGCRDAAWRIPMGESGILECFLKKLSGDALKQELTIHSLRLIGNSCADTNENRARVVDGQHLSSIFRCLDDENLIPFGVPVLFNTLVDYEPAQLQASQSRLNDRLMTLLRLPNLADYAPFVPYICKILGFLVTQDGESSLANPDTASILLGIAAAAPFKDDLDDFISIISVAAAYLAAENLQATLITGNHVPLFLAAFYRAHAEFEVEQAEDPDAATQLRQLCSSLLSVLTDITAHDSFAAHYTLESDVVETLRAWLQSPNTHLKAAACLALGNVSRSDETSTALIHTYNVHTSLTKLLSDPATADAQLLHSTLSFLKNLAIPAQNKLSLSDLLDPSCVPRIYSLDTIPQVQFAAASLTRLLLVTCVPNVRRVCAPLATDDSAKLEQGQTILNQLISLFERSDTEPTKLEAARCGLAICRVLHSNPVASTLPEWDAERRVDQDATEAASTTEGSHETDDSLENAVRDHFYRKHDMHKLLGFLISQDKWPTLRAEALFVSALISRSKDGASIIRTLQDDSDTFRNILTDTVTGGANSGASTTSPSAIEGNPSVANTLEPSADGEATVTSITGGLAALEPRQATGPQNADAMARANRENGLVLCTEMLRHCGGEMEEERLGWLRGIIKDGTELLAAKKAV